MLEQQIRFCTTQDETQIAYAFSGSGPPLVRVLNWLTHLDFEWGSPVWRHWWTELSRHHTLIRYDARGCGLSDWAVDNFSLDGWVEELETVVDALHLERFPLLGICQGSAVAIAYAARHPERVSHLVLYGGSARGRIRRGEPVAHVDMLLNLIRVGWGQDNPAFRQVYTTLSIPDGTAKQVEWYNELQRISTTPEIAAQIQAAAYQLDVCELAKQVRVPTLIFHAQEDALVPFEEGRLLAGLIPNARFVPLPTANHLILKNEPAWTRFREEVCRFLDEDTEHEIGTKSDETMQPVPDLSNLTPRQCEALAFIAQGLDNAQIAKSMRISPATLRNHITQIFQRLGVHTRAQAIVLAHRAGLDADTGTDIRAGLAYSSTQLMPKSTR